MLIFNSEHNGICRGCSLGKNSKKTFPSNDRRSKGILDPIHSDTCGSMLAPSIILCSYYVIFIDEFYKNTWIYFLKFKNETFNKFKDFKELVENETRKCICALRIDNGGEFTSHDFDDFYQEEGIKREFSMSYNPKKMGLQRRRKKLICEASKAMMSDLDIPYLLWEEVASASIYV